MKITDSAKNLSSRFLPYWVGAALTALVSVIYAYAFGWSEQFAHAYVLPSGWLVFLILPFTLTVSAACAELISPSAAGSGIPQLIAGVELAEHNHPYLKRLLGLKMIVVKFFGSCLCVAGGGVTGREGPNLQISAAIFNQIYRYWPNAKNTLNLQSMILAGGAAGLAAAFNTPLGGIVFAIEELAKVHVSRVRTYVFHAVVISGLLVQAIRGNYLYLGKSTFSVAGGWELCLLAIAALCIGACGGLFGLATVKVLNWRAKFSLHSRMALTIAFGLCMAFLVFFSGRAAIGSGREVITNLLQQSNQTSVWTLGLVRCFANFFTYTSGVIGGIFAPSLSTGAGLGVLFGKIFGSANLQLWILTGMVAFLTGVTRTPFTSMILVFEMTDSHDVIVVLMLGAIVAQGAAKLIDPISFYEHASKRIIALAQGEART